MLSLIHSIAVKAKRSGIDIPAGEGNDWLSLASACGIFGHEKKDARRALVKRFGDDRLPSKKAKEIPGLVPISEEIRKMHDVRKKMKRSLVVSSGFLSTYEWRCLRMEALRKYGARCACCGATPADGLKMHVDHIKPRRLFPQLALSIDNLQVLCEECNHGKGNWDMTDWRNAHAPTISPENAAHLRAILQEDC